MHRVQRQCSLREFTLGSPDVYTKSLFEMTSSESAAARTHDATNTLAQELQLSHDVESVSQKACLENNRLNRTNHQVVRCWWTHHIIIFVLQALYIEAPSKTTAHSTSSVTKSSRTKPLNATFSKQTTVFGKSHQEKLQNLGASTPQILFPRSQ